MVKSLLVVIHLLALIAISTSSYSVFIFLTVEEIGKMYNSVITIAALIFGVLGAWVGLLKNQIESAVKDKSITRQQREGHVARMNSLIKPLSVACIIVCMCILYNYMASVIPYIDYFQQYKLVLKFIAVFTFGVISYFQVIGILRIAVTGVDTLLDLKRLADDVSDKSQR